jgi:hypothetical protein
MPKKKHTVEQIIGKLREAEVAFAQGEKVGGIVVCKALKPLIRTSQSHVRFWL